MSNTSIIKLDIGGTQFKTSRTTLTRYDGFFKTLLETEYPVSKDEPIFVDRSPKHFEKILNYMRDGSVVLPKTPEDVEEIQNEAQYYLLTGLVELCKMKKEVPLEIRFLNNWIEETAAIVNSQKKSVLIIRGENPFENPDNISQIALKYHNVLDVFINPNIVDKTCLLYDKTTNTSTTCNVYSFEETFKNVCSHLL